ncbi:hypothetical protein B484DRAFT_434278 [Ochromonadaceae sp. CCMP2298]|nr:hypothetical protein B484DRAFT_434278 [Ochromonadaceae sp. CCMP2298]
MSTEFAEDAATDRLVRQLNEDSETLTRELSRYRVERASAVKAQNMALAAYDAEMAEIMGEADLGDAGVQRVDHQVLRHLNIERDSDLYKKFEAPSMSANAGTENRALSMEEKGAMRERMFGLLDESRMEETRLELEHEQAVEQGNRREAEEIAERTYRHNYQE